MLDQPKGCFTGPKVRVECSGDFRSNAYGHRWKASLANLVAISRMAFLTSSLLKMCPQLVHAIPIKSLYDLGFALFLNSPSSDPQNWHLKGMIPLMVNFPAIGKWMCDGQGNFVAEAKFGLGELIRRRHQWRSRGGCARRFMGLMVIPPNQRFSNARVSASGSGEWI
jgi:hypothetical protein